MDEELESLLREHYRRSAQTIQPDPGLIGRIRSSATPRRRRRLLGRLVLAAAVATVALGGGLAWVLSISGGSGRAEPAAVQAPPLTMTISMDPTHPVGAGLPLTGMVNRHTPLGLVVETETGGHWIVRASVTAIDGSYRTRLELPADVSALRVCTATNPTTCSAAVSLIEPDLSPRATLPTAAPPLTRPPQAPTPSGAVRSPTPTIPGAGPTPRG